MGWYLSAIGGGIERRFDPPRKLPVQVRLMKRERASKADALTHRFLLVLIRMDQMTDTPISFSNRTVNVGDKSMELDYPVANAFMLGDKIIVLFNPDAYTEKFGQFKNLIALNADGERIWTAELPTNESGERYYQVSSRSPLVAYSWSFSCEIDESTGRIKKKIFLK